MNYILGPMKCSGKQHPYPTEIERINKETRDRKFNAVIDQAKTNKDNLEVLDKKIQSETGIITAELQSNIENVTQGQGSTDQNQLGLFCPVYVYPGVKLCMTILKA